MCDKIDSVSTEVRSQKWILSGQLQASQDVRCMFGITELMMIIWLLKYYWSLLNAQYVISVASGLSIKTKQKTSGKGCASQLHRRESGAEPNFLEE